MGRVEYQDASAKMHFPIRSDVLPGESGQGYALRMAAENSLPGLPALKKMLGKSRFSVLDAQDGNQIAQWFGASPQRLSRALGTLAVGGSSKAFEYGGVGLERSYFVNRGSPRICPKCMAEGAFCHIEWDFSLATACPRHRNALVDLCPFCARQLDWNRALPGACDCGHPVSFWEADDIVEPVEMAFSAWLSDSVGGDREGSESAGIGSDSKLMALLRPLTLNGGLCIVYALAAAAKYQDTQETTSSRKRCSITNAQRVLMDAETLACRLAIGEPAQFRISRPSTATRLLFEAAATARNEADRSIANSILTRVLGQGGKSRWAGAHPAASQMTLF